MEKNLVPEKSYSKLLLEHPTLIIGSVTVATVGLGMLFNFGYFYSIGVEFMSFMTFDDFIDSTLPFVLAGAAFLFLTALVEATEMDNKGIVEEFHDDWAKLKNETNSKLIVYVIGLPLLVLIHIFHVIGGHIFYFLLAFQVMTFSSRTNTPLSGAIFGNDSWLLGLIVGSAIVLDRFVRGRPKKYTARIRVIRVVLLSSTVMFVAGANFLAGQLSKEAEWVVYTEDNKAITDIILLRSMERGVLMISKSDKEVHLIDHASVKSVQRRIKE